MTEAETAALASWVEEALELRFGAGGDQAGPLSSPVLGAGPSEVLEALLRVRARLDRIEQLAIGAVRAEGMARRRARDSGDRVSDGWDARSVQQRSGATRLGGDYTSAKERSAEINMAMLAELRTSRSDARLADQASEASRVIRMAKEGLEALRAELVARLRALSFESSLER